MQSNDPFLVVLRVDFDDWARQDAALDANILAAFRIRMSYAFPWSREVFGDVFVLNARGDAHDVAGKIYGCFNDALDDAGANELRNRCIDTYEGPMRYERNIRMVDLVVSKLGEHRADLSDDESATALQLIVSRSAEIPESWPDVWARPERSNSTAKLSAIQGVVEVPVDAIHDDPNLVPLLDESFIDRCAQAMHGGLAVYCGVVPIGRIVPFDVDYRPDKHPIGSKAIDAFASEWKHGNVSRIVVYPRGPWLVASDDYVKLLAALRAGADYVPCWILGRPDVEGIEELQGPLTPADAARIFGGR